MMNRDEMLVILAEDLEGVVNFLARKQIKVSREDLEQQVVLAALEFLNTISESVPDDWKASCMIHIKKSLNHYVYMNGGKGSGPHSHVFSLDKEHANGASLAMITEDRSMQKEEAPPASPTEFLAWAAKLRGAAFNAIREDDVTEIMKVVTKRAKKGNLRAVKLLFDYVLGGRMSTKVHTVHRVEE